MDAKDTHRPRWLEKWDGFWFKPQSPLPMALFRILFGLVLLENLVIHLLPDFDLYYSINSIIPVKDMIAHYWHDDNMFDVLLLLPQNDSYIRGAFYVLIAATVCTTFGVFTRVSSWLVFLLLMSFGHHFELNQNAGDNYIRISALCLALSNCGDTLSLDNLFKSLKRDWRKTGFYPLYSAPWAQRLLQIQLTIAYFQTWIGKVEGERWNDGTAVYYAVRYDDIIRFPLPHFLDQLWFYQISTWGTLAVEFALCSLIWWRPARYWVILTGISLHLGIEYFMNLPMFEWTFMFTYLLFIDPEDMQKVAEKFRTYLTLKFGAPHIACFDGAALDTVKYAGLLHRQDLFRRLAFVDSSDPATREAVSDLPQDCKDKVLIRDEKGNWLSGFDAWRFAAVRSPFLYIPGLLAYIPVISALVKIVYDCFAATRVSWFGGDVKPESKPMMQEGAV